MQALLPGITLSTSLSDYKPIKEQLQRFDGRRWVLLPNAVME
jgi:hypothetical protein